MCVIFTGKSWHEGCFVCVQCRKPLGTEPFFEKDGQVSSSLRVPLRPWSLNSASRLAQPYCSEDYHNSFSDKCAKCQQTIKTKCVTAMGRSWHDHCFVCTHCNQAFRKCGRVRNCVRALKW